MKNVLTICMVLWVATCAVAGSGMGAQTLVLSPPITTLTIFRHQRRARRRNAFGVGIYEGSHDFLDREKARLVYVDVGRSGVATIDLPQMVVGREYALAIFHDINNNGDMDRNWVGPTSLSPGAFSGEPKTRLRLPRFDEVSFRVQATTPLPSIRLRIW